MPAASSACASRSRFRPCAGVEELSAGAAAAAASVIPGIARLMILLLSCLRRVNDGAPVGHDPDPAPGPVPCAGTRAAVPVSGIPRGEPMVVLGLLLAMQVTVQVDRDSSGTSAGTALMRAVSSPLLANAS